MTEQQISTALDELLGMVGAGKPLEAFDAFYHDDLERTDLDGVTHRGKAVNARIAAEKLSQIEALRDFTSAGRVVKGNRSFLVWSMDYDHVSNGTIKAVEVAIQDWQDGKIIRERFVA